MTHDKFSDPLNEGIDFSALFYDNSSVMLVIDPDTGMIKDANSAACKYYGWIYSELCSKKITEINTSSELIVKDELQKAIKEQRNHFYFKHRLANGTIRDVEIFSSPAKSGNSRWLISIIHDITERKQLEEQLQMMKATFDVASDAAFWMDVNGRFVYVNTSACAMLGYSQQELLNLNIFDVNPTVTKERWLKIWDFLRTNKIITSETIHRRKDGSEFPVEIASSYFIYEEMEYVNGFARDISLRKRTEEELMKAQKLESLSVLAGGIAHDFNNLLGGIFGNISMAAFETKEQKTADYLARAISVLDRARALTGQLYTFSRGGTPMKQLNKLTPFIEETTNFALSGSSVVCNFTIPDDLWHCEFDKNQIGQVIDNIVINAKQAMPDGGTLNVACKNILISENQHPVLKAGRYVRISIEDQGIGIPKEIMARIFDPFFTTKSSGHGLGLATCFSIIKQHEGMIEVESEPGKGSTFHVHLPAATGAVSKSKTMTPEKFKGSGLFLVMDDQDFIRDVFRFILESVGFKVVCFENGQKMLDFISTEFKAGRNLAGAILDLTVPGNMGGIGVAKKLQEMGISIPLFASSGHAEDPVIANPQKFGFTASIAKPFMNSELIDLLRNSMK